MREECGAVRSEDEHFVWRARCCERSHHAPQHALPIGPFGQIMFKAATHVQHTYNTRPGAHTLKHALPVDPCW